MVGEESGTAPDEMAAARVAQDELLLEAVAALHRRYDMGGRYDDLSPTAVTELSNRLAGIATARGPGDGTDREEAIALAHRLVDDDHPEESPIWPRAAG